MYSIADNIPFNNYNEQRALKCTIDEITSGYPVKRIILYGSKARWDFIEDSDIAPLFITEGNLDRSTRFQISDIIHDFKVIRHCGASVNTLGLRKKCEFYKGLIRF